MHIEEQTHTFHAEVDTPGWQFAAASSILGWVLDAFDFFVVVFLFDALAANFHVAKVSIVWTISITLAMRPVGALLFGAMADRFGRKKPLMICVIYFSTVTVLSAYAPNYIFFVVMRALYGIGMGGYGGIGASFAMENAPRRLRGFLSGMMQGGYPFGYLLAAVGMLTIMPHFGWRAMFVVGAPLAAAIAVLTYMSPESEAWKQNHMGSIANIFKVLFQNMDFFLSSVGHGRHVMSFARDPGPLSRLFKIASQHQGPSRLRNETFVWHSDHLQHWCHCRSHLLREHLRENRQEARYHGSTPCVSAVDPGMGIRRFGHGPDDRLLHDADRGTRRIRRDSSALE